MVFGPLSCVGLCRWFDYKACGEVIADSRIVSVKTPLKEVDHVDLDLPHLSVLIFTSYQEYHNGKPRGQDWVTDYETGVCLEDE